ncbi:unnamed protein product [Pedinophyceae sp. YPF-701]|nr:unnamed protein product [Pedinophyceae sp. YPF-701]
MFKNDTNSAAGRPLLVPPVEAAPPGYFDSNEVRVLAVTKKCPPAMKPPKGGSFRMEDFQVWKTLGEGYASVVYHGFCKRSCIPVAIKAYKKVRLSKLNDFQVRREIAIHSRLEHPNVIDLLVAFEDSRAYYLIQELAAKGDLFVKVRSSSAQLTEKEVVTIMLPVMQALQYMHEQGLIHRDIKPENIFVAHNNQPKLGDFGLAINYHDERPVTRLGTLDYMAPEILLCHTKEKPTDYKDDPVATYGANVDCWAMGVLAYELLTGRPPFRGESRQAISQSIMSTQPKHPLWVSSAAVEFMSKALLKSSAKRPSMLDLIRHPWITTYMDEESLCKFHGIGQKAAAKGPAGQLADELTVDAGSKSFSVGRLGKAADADLKDAHRRANPGRPTAAMQSGSGPPTEGGSGPGKVEASSKSFAPGSSGMQRPALGSLMGPQFGTTSSNTQQNTSPSNSVGKSVQFAAVQQDDGLRTVSFTAGAQAANRSATQRVSRLANTTTRTNNGAMAAITEDAEGDDKPKKVGIMSRLKNAMTRKNKKEDALGDDMAGLAIEDKASPVARIHAQRLVQGSAKSYSVGPRRM